MTRLPRQFQAGINDQGSPSFAANLRSKESRADLHWACLFPAVPRSIPTRLSILIADFAASTGSRRREQRTGDHQRSPEPLFDRCLIGATDPGRRTYAAKAPFCSAPPPQSREGRRRGLGHFILREATPLSRRGHAMDNWPFLPAGVGEKGEATTKDPSSPRHRSQRIVTIVEDPFIRGERST